MSTCLWAYCMSGCHSNKHYSRELLFITLNLDYSNQTDLGWWNMGRTLAGKHPSPCCTVSGHLFLPEAHYQHRAPFVSLGWLLMAVLPAKMAWLVISLTVSHFHFMREADGVSWKQLIGGYSCYCVFAVGASAVLVRVPPIVCLCVCVCVWWSWQPWAARVRCDGLPHQDLLGCCDSPPLVQPTHTQYQ